MSDQQSMHPPAQIILDITEPGNIFFNALNLKYSSYVGSDNLKFYYEETVMQVFSIMCSSFQEFNLALNELPDFSRYPNHDIFIYNHSVKQAIKNDIKAFGISLWFVMFQMDIFQQSLDYIVSQSTPDWILLLMAD